MNSLPVMLACNGPWAALWMEQSTIVGYYCVAAGGVITLALAREALRGYRLGWKLAIATCLLVVHPAWTISADIGDCGAFRLDTSILATVPYFALLIQQHVTTRHPTGASHFLRGSNSEGKR